MGWDGDNDNDILGALLEYLKYVSVVVFKKITFVC